MSSTKGNNNPYNPLFDRSFYHGQLLRSNSPAMRVQTNANWPDLDLQLNLLSTCSTSLAFSFMEAVLNWYFILMCFDIYASQNFGDQEQYIAGGKHLICLIRE